MPPSSDKVHREWIDRLDGLAGQANSDLARAAQRTADQSDYGIGVALVAIASQLAYGNALQAANYYIANKLWMMPDEEGA